MELKTPDWITWPPTRATYVWGGGTLVGIFLALGIFRRARAAKAEEAKLPAPAPAPAPIQKQLTPRRAPGTAPRLAIKRPRIDTSIPTLDMAKVQARQAALRARAAAQGARAAAREAAELEVQREDALKAAAQAASREFKTVFETHQQIQAMTPKERREAYRQRVATEGHRPGDVIYGPRFKHPKTAPPKGHTWVHLRAKPFRRGPAARNRWVVVAEAIAEPSSAVV